MRMCLWRWFQRVLPPPVRFRAWCVWTWLLVGSVPGVFAQSSITNGCFVASFLPERTNLVCGGGFEFLDIGVSISNRCSELALPPHSIQCEPPMGTMFEPGDHTVTCRVATETATVLECRFRIMVQAVTGPPVIACSSNRTFQVPCTRQDLPVGYPVPVVTNGVLFRCEPPPGDRPYPLGTTTVTCIATNVCGLLAECSFTITVTILPPAIFVSQPTALPIFCSERCGTVNYYVQVSGGAPFPVARCFPPSGSCFPPGYTRVTCRATNACGVSSEVSFQVLVSQVGDHSNPLFPDAYRPDEGETSIGTFINHCRTNWTPVNYPLPPVVGGSLEWCRPPPGSSFPVGTSYIACRATNYCSFAAASTTFRVIVLQEPPLPNVLRLVRAESAHALEWEDRCPGEVVLQTAGDPDGPWTPLPEARPGFAVHPTERRQYFRLAVE